MNQYLPAILVTAAICVVLVLLIALGWRNRLRRQSDVAAPEPAPGDLGAPSASAEGQYVSTTAGGDWLDRIAVHSLGLKSNAVLEVHPDGLLFVRNGAPNLYIGRAELSGVRRESGMAGKFVEKNGLLVLSWRLGDREVDTGFRPRRPADMVPLASAVAALAGTAADTITTTPKIPAEEKDTQ
ncbi:hypothetical protein [Arthrobacter sp. KK5.5]|uniref:PH-like domain-containing protein n=1 Tax=Arthrobacter sp. KK5.5 TaxID=3373084 RepID=UPI003EE6F227